MKKPDFIPQDVWDKALEASNAERSYIVMAIAAAIMQDRGSRPKDGLDVVVGPAEYDDKGNMKVSYIPSYFPPPYFPPSSPMTNGDGAMDAPIDVPSDIWSAVSSKLWYGMEFRAAVWEAGRLIKAERDRIEDLLKNPAAVRQNYLRGDIACQMLIDEAAASEREACAQEMDRRWRENANTPETRAAYSNAAAAIRNRD